MSKGLYLLAIGHTSYAHWAVTLAASVKVYSPNVHITLIHDGKFDQLTSKEKNLFDIEKRMIESQYTGENGKFQPGKAKLNLYPYFDHDENIFIDADSILINEIDSLFESCSGNDIGLQVYKRTESTEDNWKCMWAKWSMIPELYKLPKEFVVSEINSSFIYSKKNATSKKFWAQSSKNYIEGYKSKWGTRFPDELAFDVATAQTGITGLVEGFHGDRPVLMHSKINGGNCNVNQLKEIAPILSYWGGRITTHPAHQRNYIVQSDKVHKLIFGKPNPYDVRILLKNKIVQLDGVQLNVSNTNRI